MKLRWRFARALWPAALAVSGCATVTHHPIAASKDAKTGTTTTVASADAKADGIRYYAAAYYLLVNTDGKGGLAWKIITLPDQCVLMTAEPKSQIASLDTTLKFQNGMLTDAKDVGDGTVVPKAILSAADKVLSAVAGAAMTKGDTPSAEPTAPKPWLFKIVASSKQISFIGGEAEGEEMKLNVVAEDSK